MRELLDFNAFMNAGGYPRATVSRYGEIIFDLFKKRKEVKGDRFNKYFRHTEGYKKDYLLFLKYDDQSFFQKLLLRMFLLRVGFFKFSFGLLRKVTELKNGSKVLLLSVKKKGFS